MANDEKPPQSFTLTVWNPTAREVRRLKTQARTINSNKGPGIKRATVIEVPKT